MCSWGEGGAKFRRHFVENTTFIESFLCISKLLRHDESIIVFSFAVDVKIKILVLFFCPKSEGDMALGPRSHAYIIGTGVEILEQFQEWLRGLRLAFFTKYNATSSKVLHRIVTRLGYDEEHRPRERLSLI